MEFPIDRQEYSQDYWCGLPFPSPEDLADPGIEPMSLTLAGRFFTTEQPGKHVFFRKAEFFQLFYFLFRKVAIYPENSL